MFACQHFLIENFIQVYKLLFLFQGSIWKNLEMAMIEEERFKIVIQVYVGHCWLRSHRTNHGISRLHPVLQLYYVYERKLFFLTRISLWGIFRKTVYLKKLWEHRGEFLHCKSRNIDLLRSLTHNQPLWWSCKLIGKKFQSSSRRSPNWILKVFQIEHRRRIESRFRKMKVGIDDVGRESFADQSFVEKVEV